MYSAVMKILGNAFWATRCDIFLLFKRISLCAGIKFPIAYEPLYAVLRSNLESHGTALPGYIFQFLYNKLSYFHDSKLKAMNQWEETSVVPVEREHAACDGHVHWHLSRHSANHNHFLPRVRVKGRVVDVLGPPELIFSQTRLHYSSSEKVKHVDSCSEHNPLLLKYCYYTQFWSC